MTTPRRTFGTEVASAVCALAAQALPERDRARYLDEWRADLVADPEQALAYATSVLGHVIALRHAIGGKPDTHTPLLCRLRLHEYVQVHDNPEDRSVVTRVCTRCGHVKDDWIVPANGVNDGLAWGAAQGLH